MTTTNVRLGGQAGAVGAGATASANINAGGWSVSASAQAYLTNPSEAAAEVMFFGGNGILTITL
jgi:hypothetical protein